MFRLQNLLVLRINEKLQACLHNVLYSSWENIGHKVNFSGTAAFSCEEWNYQFLPVWHIHTYMYYIFNTREMKNIILKHFHDGSSFWLCDYGWEQGPLDKQIPPLRFSLQQYLSTL